MTATASDARTDLTEGPYPVKYAFHGATYQRGGIEHGENTAGVK